MEPGARPWSASRATVGSSFTSAATARTAARAVPSAIAWLFPGDEIERHLDVRYPRLGKLPSPRVEPEPAVEPRRLDLRMEHGARHRARACAPEHRGEQ